MSSQVQNLFLQWEKLIWQSIAICEMWNSFTTFYGKSFAMHLDFFRIWISYKTIFLFDQNVIHTT